MVEVCCSVSYSAVPRVECRVPLGNRTLRGEAWVFLSLAMKAGLFCGRLKKNAQSQPPLSRRKENKKTGKRTRCATRKNALTVNQGVSSFGAVCFYLPEVGAYHGKDIMLRSLCINNTVYTSYWNVFRISRLTTVTSTL